MSALNVALNAVWAMEERALLTLLTIAARQSDTAPEAIEAYRAKSLAGSDRARVRDGVAIIDVIGATFKRANLFTAMSGATSYEIIRSDLQTALDDPKVRAILFNIDSPGGEASGVNELAQAVYDARGKKPLAAYVGGVGASAAYWLASAVDPGNIVVDPTALLGSIGVQMGLREREPAKGEKQWRFVSSQSPMKNASPETEAGAAAIQATVDAMAQVFVEAVARNRGVTVQTVLANFGRGGTFVGKHAVSAGLADRLGNFEAALAALSATRGKQPAKGAEMSAGRTFTEAYIDAAVASAMTATNARLAGLNRIAAGLGLDAALVTAAIRGGVTVEAFALAHLYDAAKARAAILPAGKEPANEETAEAIVARIAAA